MKRSARWAVRTTATTCLCPRSSAVAPSRNVAIENRAGDFGGPLAFLFEIFGDRIEVLVAAPGDVDHEQMIFGFVRREIRKPRQRVRGFERGNDALEPAAQLQRGDGFVVGR